MINNVVLMGRLVATPELRNTQTGVAVTSFSLAVERSFARAGEQRQAAGKHQDAESEREKLFHCHTPSFFRGNPRILYHFITGRRESQSYFAKSSQIRQIAQNHKRSFRSQNSMS